MCATFALAILNQTAVVINAKIAQLVERNLAKVEVAGSNPVFRSNTTKARVVELVDTLDLKSSGQ
jgi:hypothetical protein